MSLQYKLAARHLLPTARAQLLDVSSDAFVPRIVPTPQSALSWASGHRSAQSESKSMTSFGSDFALAFFRGAATA